ncbi:hypothetical protein GDO81_027748 [Engystomops pustulosus]|uniref:Ribosomal protein L21 n=1 Tax=Engystomops pustulosus TaxID=76066 RepID=A0AAV6YKR9_ENGPU|nr:hypothetical protein GDO81_027748 [Engystomops pustulosus]
MQLTFLYGNLYVQEFQFPTSKYCRELHVHLVLLVKVGDKVRKGLSVALPHDKNVIHISVKSLYLRGVWVVQRKNIAAFKTSQKNIGKGTSHRSTHRRTSILDKPLAIEGKGVM